MIVVVTVYCKCDGDQGSAGFCKAASGILSLSESHIYVLNELVVNGLERS